MRAMKTFILSICILATSYAWGQQQPKPYVHASSIQYVPAYYSSSKQGFICQQEWKLEKKTGLPFRFRLGTLEYTNRLEGKNKSIY